MAANEFRIRYCSSDVCSSDLFSLDTRVLSRWLLHIDDQEPEPLTTLSREPFRATFLSRVRRPGRAEGTLLIERDRRIGTGMREDIVLRNLSHERSEQRP